MKGIISCLLLCIIAFQAHGQVVAVQSDKHNIFYIGADNLLTVAVEKCPFDSIIVTCDVGSIEKRAENDHNHYVVHVDTAGIAIIEVKKKVGKEYEMIDARRFIIEYLPNPNAYYARKQGGEISLTEMNEDFAPYAKLPGFDHPPKYIIDSFTIMVVRNQNIAFIRRQAGGRKFDDATLSFFKTLRENDKLLFTDITCKIRQDTRLMHLHAMEFVIKNTTISVNGEEKN